VKQFLRLSFPALTGNFASYGGTTPLIDWLRVGVCLFPKRELYARSFPSGSDS
jgi:hypothetical protein